MNLVLVEPFCKTQDALEGGLAVKGRAVYGKKTWDIELVKVAKPTSIERLGFGNLAALLKSEDARWLQFVTAHTPSRQEWIREQLPRIIDRTTKIRNGCAHSSSAMKPKAIELAEYFSAEQVFENLNAIQQCAGLGDKASQ